MTTTLDVIDDAIIKMVYEHSSLDEMAKAVGRSKAGVKLRINVLIREGFLAPPAKKGMARSLLLTQLGKDYLRQAGYV